MTQPKREEVIGKFLMLFKDEPNTLTMFIEQDHVDNDVV
jgi:hypothetical protein